MQVNTLDDLKRPCLQQLVNIPKPTHRQSQVCPASVLSIFLAPITNHSAKNAEYSINDIPQRCTT